MRLRPTLLAGAASVCAFAVVASASPAAPAPDTRPIGRQSDGSVLLPTGQRITPYGMQAELASGGRPNGVAVRPGGRIAAVLIADGGPQVRTLDTQTGAWVASTGALGQNASYDGLAWSPDGRTLAASGVDGAVLLAQVDSGGAITSTRVITVPQEQTGPNMLQDPYPGGLAFGPDGRTLYVALSRDNALGVIDVAAGTLSARIAVGNAPHSVVVDGGTAYVSNEGGRPATVTDPTNDSAGTRIVTDGVHGRSATGTVSVVDLASGTQTGTIAVGLHPTAMALRSGRLVVVNTNSDSLSVISTRTHTVTGTVALTPYDGAPLGVDPTGVALLDDGRAAVTLGFANALALVDLVPGREHERLVPTAWYPSGVDLDPASGRLVVANLHGVGTGYTFDHASRTGRGIAEIGSVSLVAVPGAGQLDQLTDAVFADNRWPLPDRHEHGDGEGDDSDHSDSDHSDSDHADSEQGVEQMLTAPPADAMAGLPRTIQHVVYVVKENRTYDQLLGDIGRGESEPSLASFGQRVTPNTHALATQFPLLDNFYDSGRRSNDGHQWAMQGAAPDYLEKGVSTKRTDVLGLGRGTPPSSGFDALLYLTSGFIWEDALAHGKTFADFGEYTVEGMPPPAVSDVPTLEQYVVPEYSGFELTQPDVYRAQLFTNHLKAYEATGQMPNLITLTLPNDHTGGSNPMYPTPETQVADNDQGLGKIVDAISHSSFWATTAIFVVEDDTQGGPDHVDGHRGPCLVISPYSRHGGYVDSTRYTNDSVLRTIELLLGLPPMNLMDAHAVPMTGAFQSSPDLAPYTALVPDVLKGGPVPNPPLASLTGVQRLWALSAMHQDTRHLDAANPALLNHDIWYSAHGWAVPYPGERTVLTPAQVLRAYPDARDD